MTQDGRRDSWARVDYIRIESKYQIPASCHLLTQLARRIPTKPGSGFSKSSKSVWDLPPTYHFPIASCLPPICSQLPTTRPDNVWTGGIYPSLSGYYHSYFRKNCSNFSPCKMCKRSTLAGFLFEKFSTRVNFAADRSQLSQNLFPFQPAPFLPNMFQHHQIGQILQNITLCYGYHCFPPNIFRHYPILGHAGWSAIVKAQSNGAMGLKHRLAEECVTILDAWEVQCRHRGAILA